MEADYTKTTCNECGKYDTYNTCIIVMVFGQIRWSRFRKYWPSGENRFEKNNHHFLAHEFWPYLYIINCCDFWKSIENLMSERRHTSILDMYRCKPRCNVLLWYRHSSYVIWPLHLKVTAALGPRI